MLDFIFIISILFTFFFGFFAIYYVSKKVWKEKKKNWALTRMVITKDKLETIRFYAILILKI